MRAVEIVLIAIVAAIVIKALHVVVPAMADMYPVESDPSVNASSPRAALAMYSGLGFPNYYGFPAMLP